jgi:hypothetical protein
MPELPEGVTSGYLAKNFISDQPAGSLGVKSIQADATIEESLSHPPGSRANLGHVYTRESSSTILRVSFTPKHLSIHRYMLQILMILLCLSQSEAAETHPRNILLKFCDGESQTYWCQVC